jgi:hypothetical protein
VKETEIDKKRKRKKKERKEKKERNKWIPEGIQTK